MQVDKNKIISMLIGGVIIASAGVYALADQAARPVVTAVSSAVTSNVSSIMSPQVSFASEPEISSMEESSTLTKNKSEDPESKPTRAVTSVSSDNPTAHGENSMKPNTAYYPIVDPDTGDEVVPTNSRYWSLKRDLGGDAGMVTPDKSQACQAALKEFLTKYPDGKSPLIPEKSPITVPTK